MRDLVRTHAAESEGLCTLAPAVVAELWASGLMTSFNPEVAGGVEPSFAELIETWLEMAWQDGSSGWIAPNGQGVVVDGGYRLTGAWSFGSGTGHSEYVAAGFIPMDNGDIRWISAGVPELMVALLPRTEVDFTDGWNVQGLKGTGSYDYNVADVFVPEYRTFRLFTREPLRGTSPAGRMGMMPDTAAGHAAWALGVAKSMLDDVEELAATKYRMSDVGERSGRAADWSARSATSTPELSKPSSASRWRSTRRRSGSASSRTTSRSEPSGSPTSGSARILASFRH
jgi:alkylation response protein AidB-like acyl-CoA dehydrogenase